MGHSPALLDRLHALWQNGVLPAAIRETAMSVDRMRALLSLQQMDALLTLRQRVDEGQVSDYPGCVQMTFQRPQIYTRPVLVWKEGQTKATLEWL